MPPALTWQLRYASFSPSFPLSLERLFPLLFRFGLSLSLALGLRILDKFSFVISSSPSDSVVLISSLIVLVYIAIDDEVGQITFAIDIVIRVCFRINLAVITCCCSPSLSLEVSVVIRSRIRIMNFFEGHIVNDFGHRKIATVCRTLRASVFVAVSLSSADWLGRKSLLLALRTRVMATWNGTIQDSSSIVADRALCNVSIRD